MMAYSPPAEVLVELACPPPLEAAPCAVAVWTDQEGQMTVVLSHDLPFAVFGQGQESDEGASDGIDVVAAEPVAAGLVVAGLAAVAAEDGPCVEYNIHSTTLHQRLSEHLPQQT